MRPEWERLTQRSYDILSVRTSILSYPNMTWVITCCLHVLPCPQSILKCEIHRSFCFSANALINTACVSWLVYCTKEFRKPIYGKFDCFNINENICPTRVAFLSIVGSKHLQCRLCSLNLRRHYLLSYIPWKNKFYVWNSADIPSKIVTCCSLLQVIYDSVSSANVGTAEAGKARRIYMRLRPKDCFLRCRLY
jgi:hypothetical protein